MKRKKEKTKMNGLFKTAFIFLMISIVLFVIAIIFGFAYNNSKISIISSAFGSFLCFLGIVFAMFSKPKKKDKNKLEENIEDND